MMKETNLSLADRKYNKKFSAIQFWSQNKVNGFIDNNLIKLLIRNNFQLKISTLGPKGTSSEYASQYFLDLLNISCKENIYLRPTYKDCSSDVLTSYSDVMIVANAFSGIQRFYMNQHLVLLSSFICRTPIYGIACKEKTVIGEETNIEILTHPAPQSLIPWFLDNPSIKYKKVYASSTSSAAQYVSEGKYKYCVTNANALKIYNLKFVTRTRPINMLWSVFGLCN